MIQSSQFESPTAALKESEEISRIQSRSIIGAVLFVIIFTAIGAAAAWCAKIALSTETPETIIVFASTQIVCAITFFGLFGTNYLGSIESRLRVLAISEVAKQQSKSDFQRIDE
jgi:apolipoprotein N-acyltransferase